MFRKHGCYICWIPKENQISILWFKNVNSPPPRVLCSSQYSMKLHSRIFAQNHNKCDWANILSPTWLDSNIENWCTSLKHQILYSCKEISSSSRGNAKSASCIPHIGYQLEISSDCTLKSKLRGRAQPQQHQALHHLPPQAYQSWLQPPHCNHRVPVQSRHYKLAYHSTLPTNYPHCNFPHQRSC